MNSQPGTTPVYLEIGQSRIFAGACAWPGWCRSGPTETKALENLLSYAGRYQKVVERAGLQVALPTAGTEFSITERLEGNGTTDFGAPAVAPTGDAEAVSPADLRRLQDILGACVADFQDSLLASSGRELRKGPRGGGRDQVKITAHVIESQIAYLTKLGARVSLVAEESGSRDLDTLRDAIIQALDDAAQGKLPIQSSRGTPNWSLQYFVRRSAWHLLDHAWEIQDRMQ